MHRSRGDSVSGCSHLPVQLSVFSLDVLSLDVTAVRQNLYERGVIFAVELKRNIFLYILLHRRPSITGSFEVFLKRHSIGLRIEVMRRHNRPSSLQMAFNSDTRGTN